MTSTRGLFWCWLFVLAANVGCFRGHGERPPISGASAGTGDHEARLRRLEASNARYAEALEFLGKVYAQQKEQAQAQERDEPAQDAVFAVDIKPNLKLGQVNGPATALVTVVKAFDFACPYCERANVTLDELVNEYGGKLRVVYKNMVVHAQVATAAHLASCAAGKQGKYLAFKNAVWEKGFAAYTQTQDASKLGEDNLIAIGKGAGLDTAKLKRDMNGADCKAFVQADMAELEKFHVTGTPTFFINGHIVNGGLDKTGFKQLIDSQLAIAMASGVVGADYYEKQVIGKGENKFRSKLESKP